MNRIRKKFKFLKKQNRKALILFMTAGDPSLKKNEELIYAMERDGVDLVELGVPFSDPLADGPVIQASSQRALLRKTTLRKILALVRQTRRRSQVPILLMSYLNPLHHFGIERFAAAARKAGVDGVIIPDLPPEEGRPITSVLSRHGLDGVYLLAPTSGAKRKRLVARSSRGFIYYVSLTGVTGSRSSLDASFYRNISEVKRLTRLPVCAGFGVSTPADARKVCRAADGVIIGSAVVRALERHPRMKASEFSKRFIRPFARAVKAERSRWLRR